MDMNEIGRPAYFGRKVVGIVSEVTVTHCIHV